MYSETVDVLAEQAAVKLAEQRRSLLSHLVRSMLAGMYVGAAIALIFTIGGLLSQALPGTQRIWMGVCFGGALTIVIFAGAELFTGSNLVLTLGVLSKKATIGDLGRNWFWTYVGNLAGRVLLAVMVVYSGVLNTEPIKGFVLKLVETKMNLPPVELLLRGVLANWLVCLGVWMGSAVPRPANRHARSWSSATANCRATNSGNHWCRNNCALMRSRGATVDAQPVAAYSGRRCFLSTQGTHHETIPVPRHRFSPDGRRDSR